jgi:hypothetical protein
MTLPLPSTATQRLVEGQEMALTPELLLATARSTAATLHADAPPVGPVEVMTLPALSTATHNVVEGQEMPAR